MYNYKLPGAMKTKSFIQLGITLLLLGILFSCNKKDEFTIENQPVSGDFTYTQSFFIPVDVDPNSQQIISADIGMDGDGTVQNLGNLTLVSSFTFDFVTGTGKDMVSTYTGDNPADSFVANGTSVMTGNMVFTVTETIISGTGKFSKIKGGGETQVTLLPDGSSGVGAVTWTVTY
jgi:hypothetical protein